MVGDELAPGAVTLAFCFVAAPACLAATPPAHARLVCFVCCMSSLLFVHTCYLLRASPLPAISRIGSKLPLPHTFHEHPFDARPSYSLLPSDATCAACEPFLWRHPSAQNGHTRHLVATKVGAVVFATSGRKCSKCGWRMNSIAPAFGTSMSRQRDQPGRPAKVLPYRAFSPAGGSTGRQSPLNPDTHGYRSSDRAGLCCVHRLGRGRGGRREGE